MDCESTCVVRESCGPLAVRECIMQCLYKQTSAMLWPNIIQQNRVKRITNCIDAIFVVFNTDTSPTYLFIN